MDILQQPNKYHLNRRQGGVYVKQHGIVSWLLVSVCHRYVDKCDERRQRGFQGIEDIPGSMAIYIYKENGLGGGGGWKLTTQCLQRGAYPPPPPITPPPMNTWSSRGRDFVFLSLRVSSADDCKLRPVKQPMKHALEHAVFVAALRSFSQQTTQGYPPRSNTQYLRPH